MQDTRAKMLDKIEEESTSIKITNPSPDHPEVKELSGYGYTNNRAGRRKREKQLKKIIK